MLHERARFLSLVLGLILFLGVRGAAAGVDPAPPERTLSPYFVIEGGDPEVDRLPLQSTKVELAVASVIANVTVKQIYQNRGTRPINARYVFPASTRAAVHGMTMRIGDQVIKAKIKERVQAQRTFEEARKQGKSASLLEQERPNVFSMSVANVMPGDSIEVTLSYTELLVPTAGTYELAYPTVVGPRYSSQPEAGAPDTDQFVEAGYFPEGKPPAETFELKGRISSGIAIKSLQSPTHAIRSSKLGDTLIGFELLPSEDHGSNRDFILKYRFAGQAVKSGLSLFDAGGEKFFLLQVEPPERVSDGDLPPREFVFVVDVSGSMYGFPLDTAKALLRELVSHLGPVDRFNVLLFSGGSELLAPRSLSATPENVALATALIDSQRGGGGTEMIPALTRALSLSREPGLSRSFIVVTDGYISADRDAMTTVRNMLGQANVFCFGIGSGVNRYLVEGLARAGWGEPFVVTDPSQAAATARRFREYVRAPVLTDVRVNYDHFQTYDVEPSAIPDVLAERPVVLFGKWRGALQGSVTLSGVAGKGPYQRRFEVAQVKPRPEDRALPYLWARSRIADRADFSFGDVSEGDKQELIALGLKYSLLTEFTSFVAVSEVVRNSGRAATDVDQPLALPAGVSNSAVGTPLEGAPEPELGLLVALLGAGFLGAWWLRRQRAELA